MSVKIIIRGKHNTGRTTLAHLIKETLVEAHGYSNVVLKDVEPLPQHEKPDFQERFRRNRQALTQIVVETEE